MVEGGKSLHHIKKEGNCPSRGMSRGNMSGSPFYWIFSDFEQLSEILSDTKHRAASLHATAVSLVGTAVPALKYIAVIV